MKKIGILLGILLIAGVYAMADEAATLQDDLLFADVEAVALSQVEMDDLVGGYDPDAGGKNARWTRNDVEKLAKYLSQESKLEASVSVRAEWSSPSVKGGYDVHPNPGPYVRLSAGPVSVKVKLGRK